jgi:release factor glutamine methyltransferase
LGCATGLDATAALAHGERPVGLEAEARFESAIARREKGEPVAYIVGTAGFYGRVFTVSPAVLVPRPESEHLVEAALADLRARLARAPKRRLRACDVGTGSGALALTLAAELDALEVVACDVSEAALAVARINAARLELLARVRFVRGDLAGPLIEFGPYDAIVANLPYVPTAEVPIAPDPVGFEPRVAVDGGRDGLALYRRLLADIPRLAAPGASTFLEAAPGTIDPLANLASQVLAGAHVEIGEDYAGLERFVTVTLR